MDLKKRIVETSLEMFLKNGIRAIRMDDIAEELEISKRTLYENFKDKRDLLHSCIEQMVAFQKEARDRIQKSSPNVIYGLFSMIDHALVFSKKINPMFMIDLKKVYPKVWQSSFHLEEKNYNDTYIMLRKGIHEGLFRKDINVEIVARMLVQQLHMAANENIFPSDKYAKSEVFINVIVNFSRGIATAKGLEIIDGLSQNYLN